MLFSWLANRRRAKLLATPFPAQWLEYLERNVALYATLSDAEKAKLRDTTRILVDEKHWKGCGGLTMTDEVKVTIAGQAALLLLGIDHDYFARVLSILVYPSGFRSPDGWRRADGTVDGGMGALGEAWYDGPVILAWDSVVLGGRNANDGRNVVLHEFAHQLDYLDGASDGTPPLRKKADYAQWQEVMTREYSQLVQESEAGRPKVLDSYGATNHAEFFAVITEAFFEKSRQLNTRHAELYAVLSEYYGQNPADRDGTDANPAAPQVASRKPPHRRSREAAKVPTHCETIATWPGWVRFWDIHPGMARSQALRPLGTQIEFGLVALVLLLLGVGWGSFTSWKAPYILLLPALLLLSMVVLGVWLYLAVRWVDGHGVWGGECRTRADAASQGTPQR